MSESGPRAPQRTPLDVVGGPKTELPDLVTVLAHDLKNPLAALMTNLHFLMSSAEVLDEDAADALSDTVALSEGLDRLIKNLDLLARRPVFGPRRFAGSLTRSARELADRMERQAKSLGVMLSTDIEEGVVARVDADLFTRAAENALFDAMEQAPRGSTIELRVAQRGTEATLVVTAPRPNPSPLFSQPSTIASNMRLSQIYGRGLGLLCAHIAAEATGARLELDTCEGGFRITIVAPTEE